MDPAALLGRQSLAAAADLREYLGALWIVGHARDRRPHEQQMSPGGLGVIGERAQHPDRVLEPIPARDLADQRGVARDWTALDKLCAAPYPRLASVEAMKERAAVMVGFPDPDCGQDRPNGLGLEVLVLGREGVDGGRDDPDPAIVEALPDEPLAGEDVRVRVADVGPQKVPGRARELTGPVDADVAAPDGLDVRGDDVRHEAGRLRVVDVDDVAGPNEFGELAGGLADLSLRRPKRPTIALGLMQAVVDPLRDPEEVRVAGDGHPAHIHAGPSCV